MYIFGAIRPNQTLWADISSSHTKEFGEPPPPPLHSAALALGLCILAKDIQSVITDLQRMFSFQALRYWKRAAVVVHTVVVGGHLWFYYSIKHRITVCLSCVVELGQRRKQSLMTPVSVNSMFFLIGQKVHTAAYTSHCVNKLLFFFFFKPRPPGKSTIDWWWLCLCKLQILHGLNECMKKQPLISALL